MIARTRNGFVRKRRSHRLAANNVLESHVFHQPRHSAAGNIKVFAAKLEPDFACTVKLIVRFKNTRNLRLEYRVTPHPRR